MRYQSSQKGVAIITALLVVALGTITVVSITKRQQLDIHREQNEAIIQNARSFANSGERFASALLFLDHEAGLREKTDSLDDDWAQTIPPISIDDMLLQGCIVDMQGRFNLNNLIDVEGAVVPAQFEILKRLLTQLNIDVIKADAIIDWLDSDFNATIPEGAEDDYYTGLSPAYRATNGPLSSVSELQLIKGFSPSVEEEKEDYELMLPHVAALPTLSGPTPVNVNTATPQVISALSEFLVPLGADLSRWETGAYEDYPACEDIFDLAADDKPDTLAEDVELTPYLFVQDFITEAAPGSGEAVVENESNLSVTSRFYQIRVDVTGGASTLTQYSLLERDSEGRSKVIFRARDTL